MLEYYLFSIEWNLKRSWINGLVCLLHRKSRSKWVVCRCCGEVVKERHKEDHIAVCEGSEHRKKKVVVSICLSQTVC